MVSKRRFSRRNFLLLGVGAAATATVGGLLLRDRSVEMTARPTQTVTQRSATLKPGEFADTVLVNGNIITVDQADTIVQALAIKDGLILQTGANDEIGALAGAGTKTIDLLGKTVTPGLIDAHNHLQVWGTLDKNFNRLLPPEVRTPDDLLSRLSAIIAETKPDEWVQGYFWNIDPLPTRANLDPISPNNPVWLIQQGGHFACCNSLALKIADITADTPNPEGGIIERDKDGNPTGVVYNHRAMDMVRIHAPQPTREMIVDNIKFAEDKMAAVGVTTFHDCNARFEAVQAYLETGRKKAMTLRGQIFCTSEWPFEVDRALEIEHYADDHLRFAGYKFLIDGQFPTWYTREPHPGITWDMPTWKPESFKEAVKALHDTGLQVSVHCGGDAAVDLTLDAYEDAMRSNPRPDPRHRIEHASLCTKDAVQRAAKLGVVISTQPQFIHFSADLPGKLGADRASRIMVTREWLDAGITLALGSDTPTSPWYEPQVTLAASVWRADVNKKSFHPEQAITIQEALRAHTMGSAYAAFEENVKGSLEPRKFADLTVWGNNIYEIEPSEIVNTKIEMTMIGGKIVYQK